MASECHFQKDNYFGLGFIAKLRSGSGNDYRLSSPMEEITPRTSQ